MAGVTPTPDMIEVGDRIRDKRKEVNMTQKELADHIGLTDKHLSRLETGLYSMKLETFFAIATTLRVPLSDISPQRFSNCSPQSDFRSLEEKYNQLSDPQKSVVFATMSTLLSKISQADIQ